MKKFVALLALTAVAGIASADSIYLALGDSIAYGLQPDPSHPLGYNVPSNGDRGYVKAIADALTVGGVRPSVVNLALPQETSGSFFNTTNIYRGANTNYGSLLFPTMISQWDLAKQKIQNLAPGDSIDTVSLSIGANDVLGLLTPTFLAQDPLTQQAQLNAALIGFAANYGTIVGGLKSYLPNATLILPGYYNPYPAGSPLGSLGDLAVQAINATIQGVAASPLVKGKYVDFYTVIKGKELLLTHMGDPVPDIHPNDAGYAALGIRAAQAVPEPVSMVPLAMGGLAVLRRRRR